MKNISEKTTNWKRKVKGVLQNVRRTYGIKGNFVMNDFHNVREGEGIEMLAEEFHDQMKDFPEIAGALLISRNRRRLIYLRRLDDIETAMHELGHHFLQHKEILLKDESLRSFDIQEAEADYFAMLATYGKG